MRQQYSLQLPVLMWLTGSLHLTTLDCHTKQNSEINTSVRYNINITYVYNYMNVNMPVDTN